MKLLFVHGAERLKEDEDGNYYTGGSYNDNVWNRYTDICSSLSVVFRKDVKRYETSYAKQRFQFFDQYRINFIEIPDLTSSISSFTSIKKRKVTHQIIEEAVFEHDALIVRLPSAAGYIAIKYAEKYNKPYLVEVVGCAWDSLWNHSIKGKMLAFNSYLLMKKTIKKAPYAIYVTNEFLQKRYPCSGITSACSDVVLPPLDENILEKRLKKISNMDEKRTVILGTTAAVNVRYKGQEYIIQAMSRLNKEGYCFEYHLLGGGSDIYLKNIAKKYGVLEKVKFLGSLSHEKVFEYLDYIDIYIQPSIVEGLPRALIEAMSKGCPSIGSNTGGIPELINTKFLFNNGEVDQIVNILKKFKQEVMMQEAHRSFEKAREFDSGILDKRRQDFYLEFIKNSIKR